MKKITKYSLIAFVASTLGFVGCTPDRLMDWEGGKNIYFTHLMMPGSHMRAQDTVDLRFFFMPVDAEYVMVPFSVTTTGVFTQDYREISFNVSSFLTVDGVVTETPFVEGTHFEVIRPASIHPRRIEGTIWVRVFRAAELLEEGTTGFIGITLIPNQDFTTDFRETRDAPNLQPHTLLTRWIEVSNRVVRPQFWADASIAGATSNFFGPFSPRKFEIIGLANPGMPLAFLDGTMEWHGITLTNNQQVLLPWWQVLGHNAQNWLDNWHRDNPDDPIYEPEPNAEGLIVRMSMGPQVTGN